MQIETKYNLGDNVWCMAENRPFNGRVIAIYFHRALYEDGKISQPSVKYMVGSWSPLGHHEADEESCFLTREELINFLLHE